MRSSLAIYNPGLGVPSETFIRRHIEELLPRQTVVICDIVLAPPRGNWKVACPVFCTTSPSAWVTRLVRERFNKGKLLPAIDPLQLFLRRNRVEVILAEMMDQALPMFRLLRGTGIRFFVHAHGHDVSRCLMLEEFRKGYLDYRETAGIITISHASKMRLVEIGLPEQLIHVVHNGVEIPERILFRGDHNDLVSCIAVGRMSNIKAPILLLESFRRAYEQCPALRLDYVGGGELLAAAMQYVKCHGLDGVVRLHGVKDSGFVQETMRNADIFVQHSATDPTNGDMEGLPVAILEAMANGLPVVSTRHAGIPEQVVEGETGFLVEECDAGAMAEGIVRLAQSGDLRRSMGEAGYLRAKEHFSWELNRKRLCEVMGLEP